jgi:hypothetical protein
LNNINLNGENLVANNVNHANFSFCVKMGDGLIWVPLPEIA